MCLKSIPLAKEHNIFPACTVRVDSSQINRFWQHPELDVVCADATSEGNKLKLLCDNEAMKECC